MHDLTVRFTLNDTERYLGEKISEAIEREIREKVGDRGAVKAGDVRQAAVAVAQRVVGDSIEVSASDDGTLHVFMPLWLAERLKGLSEKDDANATNA